MSQEQKLQTAKVLAKLIHSGQKYGDGEQPYTYHLEGVVNTLIEYGITNIEILCAAWLHDSIEDNSYITKEFIEYIFGYPVSDIVWAVSDEEGKNRKERKRNTFKKINETGYAVHVKLVDRICNVKQCISDDNFAFYKMYKKEYAEFRDKLWVNVVFGSNLDKMWNDLDKLMKWEKE
jgi:(p)ppGpp synthase/HD superfamily hydrolase